MRNEDAKKKRADRFKTTDFETARARVVERAPEIDPTLLAGIIYTLDEKPRSQRLTREQLAYQRRLSELHRRAEKECFLKYVKEGPLPKPWEDFYAEMPVPHDALITLEFIRARVPDVPENDALKKAIENLCERERKRYRESQPSRDYRAIERAESEKMAFEQGKRAGAFAYGYQYDPLVGERRISMCSKGNFFAEWRIRACLNRWLKGYSEGWQEACTDDGAKKIPQGVASAKPQPLPEMNSWLREALADHVRGACASAAKYRRSEYKRKTEIRMDIRARYERGDIRAPNGRPIESRDVAVDTYFLALADKDKQLWAKRRDSEDKSNERGVKDLRKALIGAKRPKPLGR